MAKGPDWKGPLVLAGILLVGGSLAYWREYSLRPKEEEKEERTKLLFDLKDAELQSIRLVDGERVFAFSCLKEGGKSCKVDENAKWELTEPRKMKADDSNVNALASTLANLRIDETIDLKDEKPEERQRLLKDYQLSPEDRAKPGARRVEVVTGSGEPQLVWLGAAHPISGAFFALTGRGAAGSAKVDEAKVALAPSYFKSNLDKDLTHWRNKRLLTLAAVDIHRFELKAPKGKVSGERKDGQWTLNGDVPGDIENTDSLLSAAAFLSAEKFASESKEGAQGMEALKGAKAFLTLRLESEKAESKEPVTLTLYERKKPGAPKSAKPGDESAWQVLATVSNLDPVFEMNPGVRNRLDKSLSELRLTKLITSIERFSAQRLEFTGAELGQALVLTRKEGNWRSGDEKLPVDNEKVQGTLDKLSGNRISEFLPEAMAPKGQDKGLTLALGDDKSEQKRKLVFWKAGDKLYARDLLSPRKEAYVVDPTLKDALPWTREHFKPAPPEAKKAEAPKPEAPTADGADPHGHGHGHAH